MEPFFQFNNISEPDKVKIQRWSAVSNPSEKAIQSAFIKMVNEPDLEGRGIDDVVILGAFSELEYQSLQPCLLHEDCDKQSRGIIDELEQKKGKDITCGDLDEPFCAIAIIKPKESKQYSSRSNRIPVSFFGTVKKA